MKPVTVEPFFSDDGSANLKINNVPVHSRKSSRRDAARYVQSLYQKQNPPPHLLVIYGAGPGEIFSELIQHQERENRRVFVFEPCGEVANLLQAKEGWNEQKKNLESRGVIPVFSEKELFERIKEEKRAHLEGSLNVEISVLPGYRRLFPDSSRFPALIEGLCSGRSRQSTVDHFSSLWHRNHIRHLLEVNNKNEPLLFPEKSHGPAGNQPPAAYRVLFAGAGPNLLEAMSQIHPRETKDREPFDSSRKDPDTTGLTRISGGLLIAADTAVAPLFAAGVIPDLIISIDAGYGTLYHLIAAARIAPGILASIPVLTWTGGGPYLHRFFTTVYYFPSSLPLEQIERENTPEAPEPWPNHTGNTLGPAMHLTAALGQNPLFTAGVSFRTHKGQSHERGTGHMYYRLYQSHRTRPAGSIHRTGYGKELAGKNLHAMEGVNRIQEARSLRLQDLHSPEGVHAWRSFHQKKSVDPGPILAGLFQSGARVDALSRSIRNLDGNLMALLSRESGIQSDRLNRWFRLLP